MAVNIDGTESEALLQSLPSIDPIVALLNTSPTMSRIHASRRVFDILKKSDIDTSVIHHREFEGEPARDDIAILTGSEIGGLLVDGLGDGVLLEVLNEDLGFLRLTSFGLLQARSALAARHFPTARITRSACGGRARMLHLP
jgi:(E)-4-hydroxy-3-methylbut-2-enyl-diphosphate synthase